MPIYEFFCKDCKRTFEKLVFHPKDLKEVKCPYCKSKNVEKFYAGLRVFSGRTRGSSFGSGCSGGIGFS